MNSMILMWFQRASAPAKRLMLVALLVDLGVACTGLCAQFLGIKLNAPPLLLGLYGTSMFAVYAVVAVFSGTIADRIGRKRQTVFACALATVAWAAMPFAQNPYHLLILMPFSGIAMALFWPATQAWLADLSGDCRIRLNRNVGLFNVAWTIGIMLGPLVGGLLWAHWGTYAGFFISAGLLIISIVFVSFTPTDTREAPAPTTTPSEPPRPVELVRIFLYMAWLANFASFFSRGTVGTMFPKLGDDLGFSEPLVGFLLFIMSFSMLVAFFIARLSDRWQYSFPALSGACVLGILGMLLAVYTTDAWIIGAGFFITGLASGGTYVASLTYALHGAVHNRAQRTGFHEAVLGSGVFMGPLLGGVAAQYINLRAPLMVCAVVFAVVVVVTWLMWNRHGRATQDQSPAGAAASARSKTTMR